MSVYAMGGAGTMPFAGSAGAGLADYSSLLAPSAIDVLGQGSLVSSPNFSGMSNVGNVSGGTGMTGMQIGGAVLGGLQTLGNLWGAWQANKMAKKQFKFTKQMTNINLANQMKAYNTALQDRARSRAVMEGQTQAEMNAYVNNNSLSKNGYKDGTAYSGNNYGSGSIIPASYASAIPGWTGTPAASPSSAPSASASASSLGGFGPVLASRAAASTGSASAAASARASSREDDTNR